MAKIKFCGITTLDDAEAAVDAGADYLGFNFYPRSPRAISKVDAQTIVRALPASVPTVGVFVDASKAEVEDIARGVGLSMLQFHGNESAEFCQQWESWTVLKALRLGNPETDPQLELFAAIADYLLFDAFADGVHGGTGREIPDVLLADAFSRVPKERVFLAGGITPENVEQKIRTYQPFAVDTASGIERAPGRKSLQLMMAFSSAVSRAGRSAA